MDTTGTIEKGKNGLMALVTKNLKNQPKEPPPVDPHNLVNLIERPPTWVTREQLEDMVRLMPPVQRDFTATKKLEEVKEEVERTGIIPGQSTFVRWQGEYKEADPPRYPVALVPGQIYYLDGQHRGQGALLTSRDRFGIYYRVMVFDNVEDMAREFVNLQAHVKSMNPDDRLKALSFRSPAINLIAERCSFVTFKSRSKKGGLSMAVAIRSWASSRTSSASYKTGAAEDIAKTVDSKDASELSYFLNLCRGIWGTDYESLWSTLNLVMVGWFYRHRDASLTDALFRKCISELARDASYLEFIHGRTMRDVHRAPTYRKIKAAFRRALAASPEGKRVKLPALSGSE